MPSQLISGDASNGVVIASANDGILQFQTGAAGAKVNALTLALDGTPTFLRPAASSTITSGTVVASTSGTAISFPTIPAWARRITIQYAGLSTSGTSDVVFRIGNGSYIATGYVGGTVTVAIGSTAGTGWSTGALMTQTGGGTAANLYHGAMVLTLIDPATNRWVFAGIGNRSDNNAGYIQNGNLTLSGLLDRVQITTVGGTDTFDAGQVNIFYE